MPAFNAELTLEKTFRSIPPGSVDEVIDPITGQRIKEQSLQMTFKNLESGQTGIIKKQLNHTLNNGIDWKFGGVYIEGAHAGGVYDREKEFWQHAEVLIGMLDGCLYFEEEKYWPAYENVHRFVFDSEGDHVWLATGSHH